MPNILTHMIIGAELAGVESPEFLLGCALPDFVGMASDYSGRSLNSRNVYNAEESPDLDRGVSVHYKTDAAFDGQPLKTELKKYATEDLETFAPTLGRGSIRACADAGTEILLDGVLWQTGEEPRALYRHVDRYVKGSADFNSRMLPILSETIRQYFFSNQPAPDAYTDPGRVAAILQRRFAARRGQRLAFGDEALAGIGYCFELQQNRLRNIGERLIELTVDRVRTENQA